MKSKPIPQKTFRQNEHGVALLTILMMVALATILAAAIAKRQTYTFESTASFMQQNQALLYAQSAEAFFLELLLNDLESEKKVDHLNENWAKPMPAFPIDGGYVAGQLEDQTGKFNLSSLVVDGKINEASKQFFERVLVRANLMPQISEAVIDWQDSDQETSGGMGAENNYYQGLKFSSLTPNMPMKAVEELKQVRGFEGNNYYLIQPYVHATGKDAVPININTAPALILASIDEKLDIANVESVLKARKSQMEYFESVDQLWTVSPFDQVDEARRSEVTPLLGVESKHFSAKIEVKFGDKTRQFYSELWRMSEQVFVSQRSMVKDR